MALDQKALDELRILDPDGSAGLLAQIIVSYLKDTQALLSRIQTALEARDFATLSRDAHSLKSTSLSVGASAVGKAASALESAGRSQSAEVCPALVSTLTAEFADAEKLLREMIAPVR